jgi:hypothetical protein
VAGADNPPGALAATVLDGLDADYAVTIARDAVEAPLAVDELGGAAGARIADVATVLSQWPAAAPTKQVGAPLRVAHE